jgi:single-strand selective monofunctional uracil DNA glycosylase
MAQTGVPFGEVSMVRDWLGIPAATDRPRPEHSKRPVLGLACPRSEVSGRRLWGWARSRFGTPEKFFARFFVYNYCPLMFLEDSGRNRTPDRLPAAEKGALLDACDDALRLAMGVLRPRRVVGVGAFAADRAARALAATGIEVGKVLHPSPASPAANRGWAEQVTRQLLELGVEVPPTKAVEGP